MALSIRDDATSQISDASATPSSTTERAWKKHCLTPEEYYPRPARSDKNRINYYCKYCDFVADITNNVRSHLLRRHDIVTESAIASRTRTTREELLKIYDVDSENRKALDSTILKKTLNSEVIKRCLVNLVCVRSLPISILKWDEFHTFCAALNPELSIRRSHSTMRIWIEESFNRKKDLVRKTLQSALSQIQLSIDIWTSPNNYLVLAACAHFINIEEKPQNTLLALRQVSGHSGKVQFEILLQILEEYDLVRKVGVIMGDNSGTNDTLCQEFSQHRRIVCPGDPEWVPTHQRVRCLGHILNLAVQAFLFPKASVIDLLASYEHSNEVEEEDTATRDLAQDEEKIRSQLGALGKLHNIVVFIRSSPQRTAEFVSQTKRRIPLDNRTRWNSWFNMLRAIFGREEGTDIESGLISFMNKHRADLGGNVLEIHEFNVLRTTHEILSCFSTATLTAEGHSASLGQLLQNLDICTAYLRDQRTEITAIKVRSKDKDLKLLLPGINSCLAKLESYNAKMEASPFYALALILNPAHRTNYIQKLWPQDRADRVIWTARTYWEKIRDRANLSRSHEARREATRVTPEVNLDPFTKYKAQLALTLRPRSQDEFEDYCQESSYDPTITPLQWWLQQGQRTRWPRLSQMAIDILSIPAMSAEPERIFSGGRRTMSWDRANLSIETLEQLECQKNWARQQFPQDLQDQVQDTSSYELIVHSPEAKGAAS